MPRKGAKIEQHQVVSDPVFNSRLVSKFINHMMKDGKKSIAQRIFYEAMSMIEEKEPEEPLKIFKKAVDNVRPSVEVKSRRVGGSTYQVPMEVYPRRKTSLALRWLVGAARLRGEKTMSARLAGELLDASGGRGNAVRKKEESHRMAEANKAFAHYRW
ncbi:MAG: 30S ribosomal protein S7 [Acidobacteriota bacterium]